MRVVYRHKTPNTNYYRQGILRGIVFGASLFASEEPHGTWLALFCACRTCRNGEEDADAVRMRTHKVDSWEVGAVFTASVAETRKGSNGAPYTETPLFARMPIRTGYVTFK